MATQRDSGSWFRRRPADLAEQLDAERARAERAEQELAKVARELAEIRTHGPDGHAERILRLAETEAQALRATAARDASALLERTHAEAESHRHEVGQQLAARSTELDRREAEHEQRTAAEVGAAHEESARLLDAAVSQAEAIRRAVIVETDRLRADAVAEVVSRTGRRTVDQAWTGLMPRPGTER
jgi:Skp family chaperone for outer membrane proteins